MGENSPVENENENENENEYASENVRTKATYMLTLLRKHPIVGNETR